MISGFWIGQEEQNMKRVIATIALVVSLVAGAFAVGTVTSNDYNIGELAPGKKMEAKGFVINGAQKGAVIEDKTKDPIKIGDKSFDKRIKMKGADAFIEFDVKAGDIISVIATSSSKEIPRAIRIINEGNKIGDIAAPVWNVKKLSVSQGTVTAVKDGKCLVRGFGGGVYIFAVETKRGN